MEEKVIKGKSKINLKALIALVLLKEWGYKLVAYKILKVNKVFGLESFKISKSALYKYCKEIDNLFNDVKRELKGTRFLEEYVQQKNI
ncbi:MAG: hypothetical protein QW184_01910 [Nanopusillaceae archaeon]